MRFGLGVAFSAAALVLGCGAGTAGVGGDPAASQEPIAGGMLDTNDAAVFEEFTHWADTDNVSACTANLIAPNVLLTARHCIASANTDDVVCGKSLFGDPVTGPQTIVTGDVTVGQGSTFYRGLDVRVPSDGNDMCGYDVALIILKSAVSSITPLIPRIDVPVRSGEQYVAVGYGLNADGDQNPGRMILGDLSVHCLSDECQMPFGVAPTEFMGQAGICSGDSGGPALDGDGKIIGVVSRGSNPCATPIYSEVAPWRDFITQTVLEAADNAGYRAPFWAYSGSSEVPVGAHEPGESCTDSDECYPGTACYYDGDPTTAVCTPVCSSSAQCDAGKECTLGYSDVPGGGLCLDPPPSSTGNAAGSGSARGADQGCSLSPRPAAPSDFERLAVLGFGLVLLRLRRRSRDPKASERKRVRVDARRVLEHEPEDRARRALRARLGE